MRRKDVVLMATVTSFESLKQPTRTELQQFAELFTPFFHASSEETRRQAIAALSQCEHVPQAVALFIGSQPISLAAPFLTSSPAIHDDTLIMIARTQGGAHARAIVRRENLSPRVVDALVGLRHTEPRGEQTGRGMPHPATAAKPQATEASRPATTQTETVPTAAATVPAAEDEEILRLAREEALREQLKQLARHMARPETDRLGLRTISDMQAALLVRFARNMEAGHFATTLSDTLTSSRWLAERIMLDISGHQLATTLIGVGMAEDDIRMILTALYPHLSEQRDGKTMADILVGELDPWDSLERVETWCRADRYTFSDDERAIAPQEPAKKDERAA
ncbi:DUF2336 domain-containing protein [Rhizobium sp. NRK18]|uniref:DUF2336 domain-containing protein n=1 Tax=Rhizobium sp. NRK18 TaxID=2964667 RepID=UPI003965AAEC